MLDLVRTQIVAFLTHRLNFLSSFTFKRKGLSTSTPDGKLNRTDSTAPESGTLENKKVG